MAERRWLLPGSPRKKGKGAEKLLASMENMDPESGKFLTALDKFRESVREHADTEEAEVLPLFLDHEDAGRLVYLAQKFKGAKLTAPSKPHPHLPSSPMAHKVLGPLAAFFERSRREGNRPGITHP